jgi:protoporphyrinogen oxidase
MTNQNSEIKNHQLKKVVVIGGGPAGLTAAYELSKVGVKSIVLEMGARVGGIARTEVYKGYRLDIGGHRFFTKVGEVEAMWQEILHDDFLVRPRLSRIYYNRKFILYPLKFFNALSKLGVWQSILILISYIRSKLWPYRSERTFEEWVSNRFGRRLYRIFFKTYTEKVWGIPCHQISAEWAAQRIQNLSLPRAVLGALLGARGAKNVKSLIEQFNYPRLGPGMLWERTQQILIERGHEVRLNAEVIKVLHRAGRVVGVVVRADGRAETIEADAVISTMPISELVAKLDPPAPDDIQSGAGKLTYRDYFTVGLLVNQPDLFPDNWIYIHSPEVLVGRIQNFKNWSPEMVLDQRKTFLGLEYFCNDTDELWSRADDALIELGKQELERMGLARAIDVEDGTVIRQKKAYPVYTGEYKEYLERIRGFLDTLPNLQTVGRNGLHMYNNQDHSMLTAMLAVKNLLGLGQHDVWSVNVERSYHEEVQIPSTAD